jgi:MYXO-CTERM domain-containing protein
VCRAGVCVDDPCRLIVCPAGTACNEEGQCLEEQTNPNGDGGPGDDSGVDGGGVPVVDASGRDVSVVDGTQGLPDDMSVSAAGGGGCACSVDSQGRGGAALFLLFFGVVALLARRRKQR